MCPEAHTHLSEAQKNYSEDWSSYQRGSKLSHQLHVAGELIISCLPQEEGPVLSHLCLSHFLVGLLQCALHGATIEDIWKLQLVQNDVAQKVLEALKVVHVTLLWGKLLWVASFSWVHFKMLVITLKALHGMGSGYLRNSLASMGLVHPTSFGQRALLRIPAAKKFQLMESRRSAFSSVALTLWDTLHLEVRSAFPFLVLKLGSAGWLTQWRCAGDGWLNETQKDVDA